MMDESLRIWRKYAPDHHATITGLSWPEAGREHAPNTHQASERRAAEKARGAFAHWRRLSIESVAPIQERQ